MKRILDMLYEYKDEVYCDFTSGLMPNISKDKVIGVKTPFIRSIAKEVKRLGLCDSFMNELPHKYQEENLLHSILLSDYSKDINVMLNKLEKFLLYIDNWAVCDIVSPKIFKKYPDEVFERIKVWLNSDHEYTVRFGVVSLLQSFLDENYSDEVNELVMSIHRDEYYINMAIAWYFSYALIKQYDSTIWIFEEKKLDKWVHNKSIQKAIESYRISDEVKIYLRSLRIK